jgi:uncharacterized protein YukE
MPLCEHGATENIRRNHKSRLGESLLRLNQNLEQSRTTERIAEDQFHDWQERWSERKEQISRRLELIDRQLENLVLMHQLDNRVQMHQLDNRAQMNQGRPQLSVVTAQGHEEIAIAK